MANIAIYVFLGRLVYFHNRGSMISDHGSWPQFLFYNTYDEIVETNFSQLKLINIVNTNLVPIKTIELSNVL